MVQCEVLSSCAAFPDSEIKTVKDVITRLHVAIVKSRKPIVTSSTEGDCVEVNFAVSYGISLRYRGLLLVLGFELSPDPNQGGYFFGNIDKAKKQTQPIKGDYPAEHFLRQL